MRTAFLFDGGWGGNHAAGVASRLLSPFLLGRGRGPVALGSKRESDTGRCNGTAQQGVGTCYENPLRRNYLDSMGSKLLVTGVTGVTGSFYIAPERNII